MPSSPKEAVDLQIVESSYPHIEIFAEQAGSDDIKEIFGGLKASLADVKGPRAGAAQKAVAGIERTEELLQYLLEVREKIKADRSGAKKSGK